MKFSFGSVTVLLAGAFVVAAAAAPAPPATFDSLSGSDVQTSPAGSSPASEPTPTSVQTSSPATSTPNSSSVDPPSSAPSSVDATSDPASLSSTDSAPSATSSDTNVAPSSSDPSVPVSSVETVTSGADAPTSTATSESTTVTITETITEVPTSAPASTSAIGSSVEVPSSVESPSTTTSSPTTSTVATSSVSSVASQPTSGPVSVDKQVYLDAHNAVRAQFGASPLTWSDDLQAKAQGYADQCQLKHSDGALGEVGENLAAATGSFNEVQAVTLFTQDKDQFNKRNVVMSHFTQVVWKSTTQLGCGIASCPGLFGDSRGTATYHVCLYDPVGNVVGEEKDNLPIN